MPEVQLAWVLLLGTLTLSLHGLIIDDWTTARDHKLAIQIIAWCLTGFLFIPTVIALHKYEWYDGFIWALSTATSGAVGFAANPRLDPITVAIGWAIGIIVAGIIGTYAVSKAEKLDVRMFLYIMSILVSLGGGVLFSVTYDATAAAIGFLVIIWVVTIVFVFETYNSTASMTARTPIALSIILATGLTIGVSVALFEHHTFIILLLGWIFQFIIWAGWVIITVN